jgi:hypothetical protein
MKKLFATLFGVFFLSAIMIGCSKDGDDGGDIVTPGGTGNENTDVTFNLKSGMLENFGLYGTGGRYELDLTLVTESLVLPDDETGNVTGQGRAIYFYMISSNKNYLDNGTYTLSTTADYPLNTFFLGEYTLDLNANSSDVTNWIEITSGTVTVLRNGDTYNISINCKNAKGKTVTGTYIGTLKYFDWDILATIHQKMLKANHHESLLNRENIWKYPIL